MWKVYKRTCPNGKVYIGITKRTLEDRMKGGYINNAEFAHDIIRFGTDNIVSEVLEEHDDYDTAIKREWYYIQLYKDICYNKIGNSKSTHEKPPRSPLHSTPSTYSPAQFSQSEKYGVPLTQKPDGRRTCPIDVYDTNGNFLFTFSSSKLASETLGVNHGDIVSCCRGCKSDGTPRYKVKGYIFRYAVDKLEEYPDEPVACKKVKQYSMKGEYIRTFNSIKEAALDANCCANTIGVVCAGRLKSAGGYIWKYAEKTGE